MPSSKEAQCDAVEDPVVWNVVGVEAGVGVVAWGRADCVELVSLRRR